MSKVVPLIPREIPDMKNSLECHFCKSKTFNLDTDGIYKYLICDKCGLLMDARKI